MWTAWEVFHRERWLCSLRLRPRSGGCCATGQQCPAPPTPLAVIATTYGAGDGSTTFNLPDTRSRTAVGAGPGAGLTNRTLAAVGGEESHTLAAAETPAHTHTGTASGTSAGVSANHTHTLTTGADSVNHAHQMPVVGNPGWGAVNHVGATEGTAPSSTMVTGMTFYNPTTVNTAGYSAAHSHSGTSAANSVNHTHTFSGAFTTSSIGSSGSHNNMPPFIVFPYIIKT